MKKILKTTVLKLGVLSNNLSRENENSKLSTSIAQVNALIDSLNQGIDHYS